MSHQNGHNGNGKASPLVTVARDIRQVAHDVVELAELQAALARVELQDWWKQFITPIILAVAAGVVAASALLILLASAALFLAEAAELSVAMSLLIVAGSAIVLTLVLLGISYAMLKKSRGLLQLSKQELTRNLRWIKTALKSSAKSTNGV